MPKTSKARISATVGMMATGYDCRDILNLALMLANIDRFAPGLQMLAHHRTGKLQVTRN